MHAIFFIEQRLNFNKKVNNMKKIYFSQIFYLNYIVFNFKFHSFMRNELLALYFTKIELRIMNAIISINGIRVSIKKDIQCFRYSNMAISGLIFYISYMVNYIVMF